MRMCSGPRLFMSSKVPALAAAAALLLGGCAAAGPSTDGAFVTEEPSGSRGINAEIGQTAVVGLGLLQIGTGQPGVTIKSISIREAGKDGVADVVGVRTYEPGPAGWIGAYIDGAADLPDGGWTLQSPKGARIEAGEPQKGMAVLVKGKENGLWSVDRVVLTYEQEGETHEQAVLVGAEVCAGGNCSK